MLTTTKRGFDTTKTGLLIALGYANTGTRLAESPARFARSSVVPLAVEAGIKAV